MKFGDYFPHYYLGMAYFSQKNYDAAIREFETSERFGAIHKKGKLYEKLNSVRTLARAQLSIQKEPDIATNKPPVNPPVVTPPVVTPPVEQKPVEQKPVEQKKEEKKPEPPFQNYPFRNLPKQKRTQPPKKRK